MMNNDFWGEIISTYTEADAIEDGILTDVSSLNVKFNNKIIDRLTVGTVLALDAENKEPSTITNNLKFIAENCTFDGDGADAWGIFEADAQLGNEKFWLVPNENDRYTLMKPDEY